MNNELKVTLIQTDICWEDKSQNLANTEAKIASLSGQTDLVVLPEMFTTGFSMNCQQLAEENEGETFTLIKEWAEKYDLAIVGSIIAKTDAACFNRGFFISADKKLFYDKRHLFRMGDESRYFSEGKEKFIVEHKGFNICLLICYDLRFPIWSRNINNGYDLLIYVASWPQSRSFVWNTLLKARAIENMAYVCGVNRVGEDGLGLHYSGDSAMIDAKGNIISSIERGKEQIETVQLSLKTLSDFRQKFPAWKDADTFTITD